MNELRRLTDFRAGTPDPDDARNRAGKARLLAAIETERSIVPSERKRSIQRPALGAIFASGVAAAVAIAVIGSPSDGGDSGQSASLIEFKTQVAQTVLSEAPPLSSLGVTLEELAADTEFLNEERFGSDVVGVGNIVDLRLGYKEVFLNEGDGSTDELQHMYLVVEPDTLASGKELLGGSGQVLIDVIAPPINRETGDRGIEELRKTLIDAPERVAFFVSTADITDRENPTDEFVGRGEDDPLLAPTHPSVVLVLDEEARVAYPLLDGGKLAPVPENLEYLQSLGAEIDGFATDDSATEQDDDRLAE